MSTRTYVTVMYPGSFFPEESTRRVNSRDPDELLKTLEPGAFAFQFFDRTEMEVAGETLTGQPQNQSGTFYIGKEYSLAEVKAEFGASKERRILIGNLEGNNYARAVHCRTRNWRPLLEGDVVIPTEHAAALKR